MTGESICHWVLELADGKDDGVKGYLANKDKRRVGKLLLPAVIIILPV